MAISLAQMEIIDLTVDEVIDLTGDIEAVQDLMYLIHQNLPQHQELNGYISDDGFVVAPEEGESDAEEDDEMDHDVVDDNQQQQQQHQNGHVHSDCSICLEGVSEADEGGNVTILQCGHTFHNVCMNEWLLFKPEGECPTCKGTIEGAQNI